MWAQKPSTNLHSASIQAVCCDTLQLCNTRVRRESQLLTACTVHTKRTDHGADWLTDGLIMALTDWLTDRLTVWPTDWSWRWLTDWLTDWLLDRRTIHGADWLNDWPTDCLTDGLIMALTDWLNDRLTAWPTDWSWRWLTVWMTDWLPDRRNDHGADWLIEWPTDCLTDGLIMALTDCLNDRLTAWPTDWSWRWLTDWLTDWLPDRRNDHGADWLIDWPTDCLTEGLIMALTDWLTDRLTAWPIYNNWHIQQLSCPTLRDFEHINLQGVLYRQKATRFHSARASLTSVTHKRKAQSSRRLAKNSPARSISTLNSPPNTDTAGSSSCTFSQQNGMEFGLLTQDCAKTPYQTSRKPGKRLTHWHSGQGDRLVCNKGYVTQI